MDNRFDVVPGLIAALQSARRVVVSTGAGISAESGIPTFREAQTGLWAQYDPEELATPQAFERNPRLVWDWYAWRRKLVQAADPNSAHHALVDLEQLVPQFTLITQNVDGLHRRAGSRAVIELHGNLSRVRCQREGTPFTDWDESGDLPPRCPDCGAYLRPDVIWFGERLPEQALTQAWQATNDCDLFLSVGTSGLVEPAASLPRLALQAGAQVAIINLDVETGTRPPLYLINAPAGQALPALVAAAFSA
jgi:NAD-dependent deacetylase